MRHHFNYAPGQSVLRIAPIPYCHQRHAGGKQSARIIKALVDGYDLDVLHVGIVIKQQQHYPLDLAARPNLSHQAITNNYQCAKKRVFGANVR
jgi:hypothetical protein